MIECTFAVVAFYNLEEAKAETLRPVLAWNDAGEAMVLGEKSLVLATSFLGFGGLRFVGDAPVDTRDRPVPVVIRTSRKKVEERP